MAIESDVLVIGGGLAGRIAALAAAEKGADTRLVTAASSSLRQASGLIDVLGYREDAGPLATPFDAIPARGAHPYAVVGEGALRAGLALFDDATGARYRGAHTERNALVPTSGGRVKPTARYPRSVAPGLASDERDCLLVGVDSHPDFDAPLAAARLRRAGVPFDVSGVTVSFPVEFRADAATTRYARALDRDEGGARRALADRLEAHLNGESRVGLPALLGVTETEAIRGTLSRRLGVDVFEVPTGPPSVPGRRLETALASALERADVRTASGEPVVDYEASGGTVDRVFVDPDRRVPHRAGAYVLATGGFVGGGIDSDREAVREPVFGCPVVHPEDRDDWYEDDPFGEHAFSRMGIDIDGSCRPLDREGEAAFGNLHAAGSVIGGADLAAEKSGSGVSIATGYRAGTEASERT